MFETISRSASIFYEKALLREQEPLVQVELPFSVLLKAVDQLSMEEARLLHRRLEDRLTKVMTSSS